MTAAADPIWHVPRGIMIAFNPGKKTRVHYCPFPVVASTQRRDVLDPCALGTCRYCRETLPT